MESQSKQSYISEHVITETTSVISHQLKTPLSAIKSSIEVLISGDLGELTKDQKEYLVLALENVERMILLIKDILDASRIDENRLELKLEPTDLAALVKGVIDDLTVFAEAKNTKIVFQSEEGLPRAVMDSVKIQQVVNNILFNAIRYNKGKGSIEVGVRRDDNSLLFFCKDNGIGVAPEDRGKMFTKFFRSPRVSALAPEGSGLGLFISKAIIEQSGGNIWFEGEVDKGTTFYFTLPIQ